MAKKEEKVVETTDSKNDNKIKTPEVKQEGGDMKVKTPKTPRQFVNKKDNEPVKVDLDKFKKEEVEEDVAKVNLEEPKQEPKEEPKQEVEEKVEQEIPVLEEIVEEQPQVKTEEEVKETVEKQVDALQEEVKEEVKQARETGQQLPDNIKKVMDFMDDTGGSLDDYVRLNQDYSKYDDNTLLREYYKQTHI